MGSAIRTDTATAKPDIRRLWSTDKTILRAHFDRLEPDTRRLRFGTAVSPAFLADYADHALNIDNIVYGAFIDGTLRGVGELRALLGQWPKRAEIALSVETGWQHAGIGDALFSRMVAAAQNRGVRTLFMQCLRENAPMRRLAQRHAAALSFELGEVEATLDPPWPTPLSLAEEIMGDTRTYLRAMLQPKG